MDTGEALALVWCPWRLEPVSCFSLGDLQGENTDKIANLMISRGRKKNRRGRKKEEKNNLKEHECHNGRNWWKVAVGFKNSVRCKYFLASLAFDALSLLPDPGTIRSASRSR